MTAGFMQPCPVKLAHDIPSETLPLFTEEVTPWTTTVSKDEDPMSLASFFGLPTNEPERLLTLKAWKESLKSGRQMLCTYRWYWENGSKPKPEGGQLCTILHVRATQLTYSTADQLKPVYMVFPRASELKATEAGFELYFPVDPKLSNPATGPDRSGKLMSRYEWVTP